MKRTGRYMIGTLAAMTLVGLAGPAALAQSDGPTQQGGESAATQQASSQPTAQTDAATTTSSASAEETQQAPAR